MSAVFEQTFRTRGYEVDRTGSVSLPVLLSYLEHLRWEWMHAPSFGLSEALAEGHFFVVREQAIEVLEPIAMREELLVTGTLQRVGRSEIRVLHAIRDAGGRTVAQARVVGLWLNPQRRLARIPNTVRAHVPAAPQPPHFGAGIPPGVPGQQPPADARVLHLMVRPSDCDRFEHVNAGAWLRLADDARVLSGDDSPSDACALHYDREAVAGEQLTAAVWRRDDVTSVVLAHDSEVRCRAAIRSA